VVWAEVTPQEEIDKKQRLRDSENTINIKLSIEQICRLAIHESRGPCGMQAQGRFYFFYNLVTIQYWELL
jgi:hypothetical protein